MVGSSKILTVSYGTFSCTLEGFDDPFSTMRSIAEYFRDLAADDRYFGAEPPTPDAEMLHKIAEREIQRRVEARVDGEEVVLRQIDSGLVEDESDLPASEALEDMADVTSVEDETEDPLTEIHEHPVEDEAFVEEDAFEASSDETDDGGTVDAVEELSEPEEDESQDEDQLQTTVSASDSIEEKLNKIRAAVQRTRSRDLGAAALPVADLERDDADEEASVADMAPGFDGELDESLISQVLADSDDGAADDGFLDDDVQEEDLADLASLDGATDEELVLEAEDMQDEDDISDGENTEAEDAVARMLSDADPETLASDAEALMELPSDETSFEDEDHAPEVVIEAVAEDQDEDASDDEAEEEPVAETDEPEADAVDASDEDDSDDLWERDFDAEAETEDEANDDAPEPTEASIETVREERPTSKSIHLKAPDEESDRLETETETAFQEGAGTRRRSAIAHLKAAVAATRADKILSRVVGRDHAGDPEEQKDYRDDLSKVVKPSRPLSKPVEPVAEDEPHVEPEDERPSPLMLVSELRIEDEAEAESATPRRVSREVEAPSADDADSGDFAEFAKRMGANDLTDLMEAAAAYTAFVEGQTHFSRPQIMRRVAKVDPIVEESREAGLRSFGQLLRQGRIQKLQRGQFTIDASTRFKPEQRIAGE